MNKLSQFALITAVATLGVGGATAAFAQEATYDYPQAAVSSVTRAQVQAELAQARRDGTMRVWSTSYNHMAAMKSTKTRDEVRAEALGAHSAAWAALSGEDSGSFAMSRQLPARASGTVLAAR